MDLLTASQGSNISTRAANLLPSVVLSYADATPEATAFRYLHASGATQVLTYGDLSKSAHAVARGLNDAGCEPGARVALMCGHGPEFMIGLLGIFVGGFTAVPVVPPTGPAMRSRAAAILAEAGCALILVGSADEGGGDPLFAGYETRHIETLIVACETSEVAQVVTRATDVAVVQYTSGSTTSPRGVIVTHGALEAQQRAIVSAVQPEASERVVTWLPHEHDMGLMGGLMFNLWRGQETWVLSPAAFIRRPVVWLDAISRFRATISVAPNFAYDLCVRAISPERCAGLDLSSWRVALNGAEPVQPETMERFAGAFDASGFNPQAFLPCYGLAEATLLVSGASRGTGAITGWFSAGALEQGRVLQCPEGQGRRLASSGPVRTTGGVRIVDAETRQACRPDRTGEIWVVGESLGSGYLGRAEDSQQTFGARTKDGDGPYLRSGDIGFLWQDELYVIGRIKDTVLWHGRTLYAADLEHVLDGADARARRGRIAVHQGADGRVALIAEVAPAVCSDVARGAELAARLWRHLLGQTGVEAQTVRLVTPGSLLWTSSGKLRRSASHARMDAEPERVSLNWHPDNAKTQRMQAEAVWRLANATRSGASNSEAFLAFFTDWVAAATDVASFEVDPGLPWADQGLDSLMMTELVLDLETATGQQVAVERLFDVPDPQALAVDLADRQKYTGR